MSKRDLWGDRHPDCPERQQLRPAGTGTDQDFPTEEDTNFGSQSQLLGSGAAVSKSGGGSGVKTGGGPASTTAASGAQGPVINLRLEPLNSASLSLGGRGLTPAGSEQYLGGSNTALTSTGNPGISSAGLGTTPGAISSASLAANTSNSTRIKTLLYYSFEFVSSNSLFL